MTAILTDPHLRQCIADIVKQAKVSCIVETGTNDGSSAVEFSKIVPRVITVEIDIGLRPLPGGKLSSVRNVEFLLGSSPMVLAENLHDIFVDTDAHLTVDQHVMFVLDAHWQEYWPLKDELRVINEFRRTAKRRVVVMIDDWLVPGCPQFTGCYGGLRSDDSKGREHELQPCAYETFAAELDSWPCFIEPIYPEGGIGYCIFSDFELELGENFRRVR